MLVGAFKVTGMVWNHTARYIQQYANVSSKPDPNEEMFQFFMWLYDEYGGNLGVVYLDHPAYFIFGAFRYASTALGSRLQVNASGRFESYGFAFYTNLFN